MVRVNANGSVDDKKDTSNKKKPTSRSKKTTPITGVWPCKINGCNKEFAREADLKRHQRTTKLHSLPSFACPQCEATFTRPDALRRHQKSRHNGVIIEPRHEYKNEGEDDIRSSVSAPGSRSGSIPPSPKEKDRGADVEYMKYYRSHTATSSPHIPSRGLNPHYDQISLPTSATRLNTTPDWSYSHPWPDYPQLPPIGHPHVSMHYTPSPHYRIEGPPPMLHPISQMYARPQSKSQESSSRTTLSNRPSSYGCSERSTIEHGDSSPTSSPRASVSSGAPVIDPRLENSGLTDSTVLPAEHVRSFSIEVTQAAMKAVIEPAKQEAEGHASSTSHAPRNDENSDVKLLFNRSGEVNAAHSLDYQPSPSRRIGDANIDMNCNMHQGEIRPDAGMNNYDTDPEPSQLVGNEEEAMLNPARWLTQELLAPPPP